MFVANSVIGGGRGLRGKFAVWRCECNELAACEFFRGSTFVGMDVCHFGAEHGVIGMRHCLQTQDIGRCSIENEKYLNIVAEVLTEFLDRRSGVRVVTVSHRVSMIMCWNRRKDFGMGGVLVIGGVNARRCRAR